MTSPLKIVVVEGDAKARLSMVRMLKNDAGIEVAGIASDVMQARMQVKMRKPDVLLLAVDRQTDAVATFLTQMMADQPVAVVMLARQVLPNSSAERQAIRSGVATMIVKPAVEISVQQTDFFDQLIAQIKRTAQQFTQKHGSAKRPPVSEKPATKPMASMRHHPASGTRHRPMLDKLIAIGASTGGTEALRHVIAKFPADTNAVVIVQHIPKAFAASLIDKLDQSSPMHVVSAEEGMEICKGTIYVGAGDEHFTIERNGQGYICHVGGKERVSGHCPSVNMLFDSVAKQAGSKAVGAIMTGMGEDGATGLKKMRESRARTVAQDKASSVVWGMPGVAVKIGAAEEEVALNNLGDRLIALAR